MSDVNGKPSQDRSDQYHPLEELSPAAGRFDLRLPSTKRNEKKTLHSVVHNGSTKEVYNESEVVLKELTEELDFLDESYCSTNRQYTDILNNWIPDSETSRSYGWSCSQEEEDYAVKVAQALLTGPSAFTMGQDDGGWGAQRIEFNREISQSLYSSRPNFDQPGKQGSAGGSKHEAIYGDAIESAWKNISMGRMSMNVSPFGDRESAGLNNIPMSGSFQFYGTNAPDEKPLGQLEASQAGELQRAPRPTRLRYSKGAPPSKYCHVCGRNSKTVVVAVCANNKVGLCKKVVCNKCLIVHDNKYDFTKLRPTKEFWSKWTCTHCRGSCPDKARCHQYQRNNAKRKQKPTPSNEAKEIEPVAAVEITIPSRATAAESSDRSFISPLCQMPSWDSSGSGKETQAQVISPTGVVGAASGFFDCPTPYPPPSIRDAINLDPSSPSFLQ